jgi:AraC family transcriptional regulator, regulatory protein of adaptative response / methylated-DNA-[protein]-cysteine methyltransferase
MTNILTTFDDSETAARDYARVEAAIRYLSDNYQDQPGLAEMSEAAGLSEAHFQKMFTRWAGLSPKRFVQYLTLEHAKQALQESRSVLDVSFDVGLSGPGRLHDLFVACEAMTPGEYKAMGEGLLITYGFAPCPFGECLVGETDRGVCGISFVDGDRVAALEDLQGRWPGALFQRDDARATKTANRVYAIYGGEKISGKDKAALRLILKGTNFQLRVWEALMRIPSGCVTSYEDLARRVGKPGAARAVAGAVARNPLGPIVPCHRVIRSTGAITGYYWGPDRKRAILGWEAAREATRAAAA